MSDEMLVRYCSPTLAGIKTANMFALKYSSCHLLICELEKRNVSFSPKGVRVLPLRFRSGSALIYLYRPERLGRDLRQKSVCNLLSQLGYDCAQTPEAYLSRLIYRLYKNESFPHEIGLFLGYPAEDVCGFIKNEAAKCKFCGYWKVYGDEMTARALFERYKKCTNIYAAQLKMGKTIEFLTVAEGRRR